jgi:hypothetical protein
VTTRVDIAAVPTAEKAKSDKLSLIPASDSHGPRLLHHERDFVYARGAPAGMGRRLHARQINNGRVATLVRAMLTRIAHICLLQIVLATTAVHSAGWADSSPFREKDRAALVMGAQAERIIESDFSTYDHDYLQKREGDGRILYNLAGRLAARQAEGNEMACSNQIFMEAKWLYHYTADWARLDRHLSQLAESLKNPNQAFALRQSPENGLWGPCYEEWFLRIEATFEALQDLYDRGKTADYPILDLGHLSTPDKFRHYIDSLLISDIARTGRDNRGELATITTVVTGASFKTYLIDFLSRQLARSPKEVPEYASFAAAYEEILSNWQDPQTGYWGAWYRSSDKLYRTVDLSMTYHTVTYRNGEVDHWPEIIKTTLDIKNEPYPYGWQHNGELNNHNNYDVARILRLGWPHMDDSEKPRAINEIRSMMEWTLTQSLKTDGRFKVDPTFFSSLAAEYYYGVSFLDQIGYWNKAQRFWTDDEFPDATKTCELIAARVDELPPYQWETQGAIRRLDRNCGQPREN